MAARTEGIFLDPVYSGKAMAGLIDLIRREKLLFLPTGGAPSLFAIRKSWCFFMPFDAAGTKSPQPDVS